jgi:hypothetical protein
VTQGTTTSESGAILLRVVNQDDGSEREERASELYSFLDQGFHSSYQPTKKYKEIRNEFYFWRGWLLFLGFFLVAVILAFFTAMTGQE